MKKEQVIETTTAAHTARFGTAPESVAWAPGRIEVVGNHTDYNDGTVLSAAIDLGHCFCISRSSTAGITVQALDLDEEVTFETGNMDKVPDASWANYIKGVFYYLEEHLSLKIENIDCSFKGSIPMGAGLSSSAALEVATSYAILDLLDREVDQKLIAKFCQKAEQIFAGTNCGLLDQFSSIFGRHHGLIHSDFRSLEVTGVDFADDIEFLVVNPHVKHSLADSPYNERRERCEQAAEELNALLSHEVTHLRDVTWEQFEANRGSIQEGAAKRAAHVVGEITRVAQGLECVANHDFAGFGELLFQSHQSSIDNFENSCAELDVVVQAARDAGALGARLSGGGFGGSAIVMVKTADSKAIGDKIKALCQPQGFDPEIVEVIPSSGAEVVS